MSEKVKQVFTTKKKKNVCTALSQTLAHCHFNSEVLIGRQNKKR